jgi:peroxiredoxin
MSRVIAVPPFDSGCWFSAVAATGDPIAATSSSRCQNSSGKLEAHGINVAAITYGSRETLSNFAHTYKLDYRLLSDAGSKVIRDFGILNTNIPADHPMTYGIPWPGDYLLAPDGTVRDKLFLPNYEYRPSASQVLLRHFSDGFGNAVEIKSDPGRPQPDYALASEEAGLVGTMSSAEFKSPLNSTCPLDRRLAQTLWCVGL